MGQKESRLLGPHKRWIERKRIQRSERPPPLGAESITPPEPHSSAVLAIGSVDHGIQENGTLTRPREVNTKGLGSQPWYFGDVTRENAEALLLEPSNEHGSFLVRIQGTTAQGTTAQGHCLSVRDGDLVKHFRLHEEGGHVSIAPGQTFSSIIMLISYFLEHDVPQICLRQPCEQVQSCKSSSSKTFQEATNQKLDLWEIQRDALMFIRILGTGEFGEVWQGLWNKSTPVAIKTMKPGSMDVSSFMDEARLMKCFRHPHLVCLYAVCSTEEPLFIITEYLAHGALRDFLRGPEGQTLSPSILIGMAAQVASGMAYLESHSFHPSRLGSTKCPCWRRAHVQSGRLRACQDS
uniref:Tyrosine-protein kinase n=1 Tax=Eptatretus burgeri TaxID=7764 RepID=A0A8C4NC44_EPTBU